MIRAPQRSFREAFVGCSLLRPDPAQRPRLVDIRDNLIARIARIAEAEREGWLGEVDGLEVGLAGAEEKLAQLDGKPRAVSLGIPTLPRPSRSARSTQ
ncbi:hypothetical protein [Streptomyces albicerus]|uniref:hypothetical protein n=1 Tax=Streptomyces albicerus TaxID=2569859 RepID=UPI001CED3601|nr:hypothetical protein [Streptomyces albicerus]